MMPYSPLSFYTYSLWMLSLRCKALWIVISILDFWSICWSSFFVYFKNGNKYLKWDFFSEFAYLKLSYSSEVLFSNHLFSHSLIDCVRFKYLLVHVVFLFSKRPNAFLVWQFIFLRYFPSPSFYYEYIFQIPFLHLRCIFIYFFLIFTSF